MYWFYGPTGSGKSRCAEEMFPNAYWAMSTGKWWEGYDGQEVVIINDYRKDFCKFHELLNLLDRYPYRVECKGGSRQFTSKTIVITTPLSPEETWENRTSEDLGQLLRRIDNILFFGNGTELEQRSRVILIPRPLWKLTRGNGCGGGRRGPPQTPQHEKWCMGAVAKPCRGLAAPFENSNYFSDFFFFCIKWSIQRDINVTIVKNLTERRNHLELIGDQSLKRL